MLNIKKIFIIIFFSVLIISCQVDTSDSNGEEYTKPSITSINPISCYANAPNFTLKVYGRGFTKISKIFFNGIEMKTEIARWPFSHPDSVWYLHCQISSKDLNSVSSVTTINASHSSTRRYSIPVHVSHPLGWITKSTSNKVNLIVGTDPILFYKPKVVTPEIFSYDYGESQFLKIINDKFGNSYIIWNEFKDSRNGIVHIVHSRDQGETWSIPFTFNRNNSCLYPDISVDDSGIIHVTWWEQYEPSGQIVITSSSDLGKTWSSPAAVMRNFYHGPGPVMASNLSECAYLVASSWEYEAPGLFLAYLRKGDTVWQRVKIYAGSVDAYSKPVLGMGGGLHISYRRREGGDFIYSFSKDSGISWTSYLIAERIVPGYDIKRLRPIIDVRPENNMAYAMYNEYSGGRGGVIIHNYFFKSTNSGKTWDQPIDLATIFETDGSKGGMAINSRGDIYILLCNEQYIYLIYSSDRGQTWSPPMMIAPGQFPNISIDSNDNLYLAWLNDNQIYFCRNLNQ